MIDFICISGTYENRVTEYVNHLHEHFKDPCQVQNAAYVLPCRPGYSIEMFPESIAKYTYKK